MRRILAGLALVISVVVPPLLLTVWGFTDVAAIHLWSVSDVRVLMLGLTVLGWAAWAVWLISLAVEMAVALSGRRLTLPTPGLGAPRALASALVTMILVGGLASQAHAAPTPSVMAPATPGPAASASAVPAERSAWEKATVAGGVATGDQEVAAPAQGSGDLTHRVVSGDDLWSLAETYYDDGAQWRQLVQANPTLQADPMAPLSVGQELRVPQPVRLVTVQAGDTLSKLARTHLGDPSRWPEIHSLNAGQVKDPDLIRVGWVLKVPRAAQDAAERGSAGGPGRTAGAHDGGDTVSPDAQPDQTAAQADPADQASFEPSAAPEAAPEATASGNRTPAEAKPEASSVQSLSDTAADVAATVSLLGGLTAMTASAVMGGLMLRRRIQEQSRPVGRRFAQPEGTLAHYEAALAKAAGDDQVERRDLLLARAMRALSQHWQRRGEQPAALERLVLGDEALSFHFAEALPSVPSGFTLVGRVLSIGWAKVSSLPESDAPVAFPAVVTLGREDDGSLVMIDVMNSGVLGIRGEDGADPGEVLSGMLVELSCSPWASEVDLLVVTEDPAFARAAGEGRIACTAAVDEGVTTVERLVEERGRFMSQGWDVGRLDPDLASAWTAQLVLFENAPSASDLARLEKAVESSRCGVAAVAPVQDMAAAADWTLTTDSSGRSRVETDAVTAVPQTVPQHTREAIAGLLDRAQSTDTQPAPWWSNPRSEDDVNIIALRPLPAPALPEGPRLQLLGPIDLVGCAGTTPPRAIRQCVEYCAWLHLRDGGTPVQMCQELLVAEGTRRSNMSRLRTWLGTDADGNLYLPDAYSGRIELTDAVGSDWAELNLLVSGGVNRQPLDRLLRALELVRGAPLADAAPGQWGWAEEFRSDAAALIRDIGVVAGRTAREKGDLDRARWAVVRALAAAPDDELLFGERIRIEKAAGRREEVHRLSDRLMRNARTLGTDLLPETVDLLQEVLEGRRRARA